MAYGVGQAPSVADFMKSTGSDFNTASQLLYGNVGANQDQRDWSSIMSAANPVQAAQQATASMYNDPKYTGWSTDPIYQNAANYAAGNNGTVLGTSGNLTQDRFYDPARGQYTDQTYLTGPQGQILTSAGNPSDFQSKMANFGFNPSDLSGLQSQLQKNGTPSTYNWLLSQGGLGAQGGVGLPQQAAFAQANNLPTNVGQYATQPSQGSQLPSWATNTQVRSQPDTIAQQAPQWASQLQNSLNKFGGSVGGLGGLGGWGAQQNNSPVYQPQPTNGWQGWGNSNPFRPTF